MARKVRCTRNCQYIFLVAIASCVITGYVYQYLFAAHMEAAGATSNFPNVAIRQKIINTQIVTNTTTGNEALSFLSRYFGENILNKPKYSADDFSFFWLDGDGSPLYVNHSKYKHYKYKSFVFCPVPKVGCSSWKQVIKRIKGIDTYLADDYWSLHDPIDNQLDEDRIHRLGVNGANQLLFNQNQQPFYAVFVRDPISRALSAWLDKCINSYWTQKYWCNPSTPADPGTRRPIGIFSQFDLFIESIINKPVIPIKARHIPHSQIWALDFHWLPQNFICDLYKFIDRYTVYHAENNLHRKKFLVDIGGLRLWKKIGAHGWIKRGKQEFDNQMKLHYGPDNNRKVKDITINTYFDALLEWYNNITKSFRKYPPTINKLATVSAVNVSLLESMTFHQSNAMFLLFKYYRSDLLAKAITYYEDDYVLFNMRIPNIVCDYLKYGALKELMKSIIGYSRRKSKDVNLENSFKMQAIDIFHGNHSIYGPEVDYRGNKTIHTVDDKNHSISVIWNRDKYTLHTNLNTKIKYFYDMMDFDDEYSDKIFGINLSNLRGMMTLINIISIIDPKIWPKNTKCFNLKKHEWNIEDTSRNELTQFIGVIHDYFINMIPMLLRAVSNNDTAIKHIHKKLSLWTDHANIKKIDIQKLIVKWVEQDNILYANIKSWMLYQRDVPRQMYYQHKLRKPRKKVKTKKN